MSRAGSLVLSSLIAAASIAVAADTRSPARTVVPANLSELSPAVRRLVLQKVEDLESRPEDPGAWGDLGLAYEANLLWLEARSCFERAVELAPGDISWRFHLAVATHEAGDFAGALQRLRILAAEAPTLAPAQQRLGLALLATGELEGALAAFSRLIELLPSSPAGYLGAAAALLGQGLPQEAITLSRRALELDPRNRGAHHSLGLALRAAGRGDESRRELALGVGATERMLRYPLAAAVERYAVHLTARIDRSAALLAAGRPDEAQALLELCLADHPENVTVLNNLAVAHLRQGEIGRARELLDRALAVNEAKFSTWINLSSWALRAGQLERALEYSDAAVERGPQSARAHTARAQVYLRLGRHAEAASDFERAAALEPWDPRPRLAAAGLSQRLGRNDRARALYGEALDLQPDLLPALLGLGRLELSLGQLEDAHGALEAARAIAPTHPKVVELGRALAVKRSGG